MCGFYSWCSLAFYLIEVWTHFVDKLRKFLLGYWVRWIFFSIRLEQQWDRNLDRVVGGQIQAKPMRLTVSSVAFCMCFLTCSIIYCSAADL